MDPDIETCFVADSKSDAVERVVRLEPDEEVTSG